MINVYQEGRQEAKSICGPAASAGTDLPAKSWTGILVSAVLFSSVLKLKMVGYWKRQSREGP